jgi:hypothetical protein
MSLLALLLSGCLFWGNLGDAQFKETRHMTVAHQAGSALKVTSGNGAVTVKRGSVTEVQIDAEIRCTSEERLAQTKIVADRVDGKLNIEVAWPGGRAMNNEGCRFDIIVPDAKGVEVTTSNGSITVSGLAGEATLRSSNGAIRLSDQDGPADATTSNGRIELQNVAGSATATTTNGAVIVNAAKGSVRATSTNGSINVQLTDDNAGPVSAASTNGAIDLTLGKAFAGTLNAATTNGSIDIPNLADAKLLRVQKHSASLAIGQSAEISELRTTNGSIRVHASGQ